MGCVPGSARTLVQPKGRSISRTQRAKQAQRTCSKPHHHHHLQVCGSLAKLLWGGLTHWVNLKQQVPSKKRIAAYAAELCEYEVREAGT